MSTDGSVSGALDRQLDWRFLLPATSAPLETLRIISDDPTISQRILDIGLSTSVVTGGFDLVDAAVVLTGRPHDVIDAVQKVRPGGVFYGEIEPTGAHAIRWSPANLCRSLTRAGADDPAVYWRRRRHGANVLFLPLDVPGALPWYLREAMDDRAATRRQAHRLLLRFLRGNGRWFASIARRYAVVGTIRSPVHEASARDATPALLGEATEDKLRPVLLARGGGCWSRVVLLAFGPADTKPRSVTKAARRPHHNHATEREQRTLVQLHEKLPPGLAVTVPVALGVRRWSGLSVGTEGFLSGRPLAVVASGPTSAPTLRAAVNWLIEFGLAGRQSDVVADSTAGAHMLDDPLRRCVRLFDLHDGETTDEVVEHHSSALAGSCAIPLVWQHGDLTPRNMRWNGRQHAVVDWEAARVGPALSDLFYLLLHWNWPGQPSFDQAPQIAFSRVFGFDEGDAAREAAEHVITYAAALRIDQRLFEPLLLNMLTQQALDRADRVQACGVDPANDANLYAELIPLMLRGTPILRSVLR